MSKGRISIKENEISLFIKNKLKSSHSISELQKFYCLLVGSDIQGNDSTCYLLVYDSEIWLIPEITTGSEDLRQWFNQLKKEDKIVIASLDYLPFSWRSIMLVIPGLEANLKVLNRSEISKIEADISPINNMTIEEAF
ncbi:hypothetical protein [Motiliproteus sp. MSK22-1]|uniref:hypothetical protein n=1 Tax=Motiliproteus sp. MSK22-1 TaxID=1897630 RepID=UPI000976DF18|nr:hypothetical protein [Motiliproteus sp. MSK22-1]OMH29457.1 hypothetical protein BGP75_19600 [Motiliproteus sp. MSK22-1]